MGMIQIAICDDEVIFAKKIKAIVEEYCIDRQITYEIDLYQSGNDFLANRIKMMSYQIVFLDINMEEIDGLETAREMRKVCRDTILIFVTAYINYTLEGYKVDAIRYIMKTADNLRQSIYESLDVSFEKMEYKTSLHIFEFVEGKRTIELEKIIYIESKLHKLKFHVLGRSTTVYTMYDTINNILTIFDKNFVRIHQSFLVNLWYVRKITGNELLLSGDIVLPIARSKLKEVREQLAVYKGDMR